MTIATPRLVWPYVITGGSNDAVRMTLDASGAPPSAAYSGTLASGTYVTPESLGAALVTAINASTRAGPVAWSADGGSSTFTLSAAGIVTITLTGCANVSQTLAWSTNAASQALGTLLGFGTSDSTATASGGTATFTASSPITQLWTPVADSKTWGVLSDTGDVEQYERAVVRTAGGQNKTTAFQRVVTREIVMEFLAPARVWQASESSTVSLQRFWRSTGAGKFRWSPDRSSPATSAADYFLLEDTAQGFRPERQFPGVEVYRYTLKLGAYNA